MFLPIGNIAISRAKSRSAIRLISLYRKNFAANITCKSQAILTNFLMGRWFVNNFSAQLTRTRRNFRIWYSFRTEQVGVFFPILIVSFGVTWFTKCNQIVFSIGIPHIFKKTIRDYMVTIKRFSCSNHAAILTNVVITFENRFRYFGPILTPIR